MSHITIDADLLARLNGLGEPLEFRNESGRVLGHFIPALKPAVQPHPEDGCPYTAEELQRMRNEKGGRPLAEIWRELGAK
jgi:hypothetical protein